MPDLNRAGFANGKSGYGPVGSAPDAVKAARDLLARCGEWPFPWSYPPPGSKPMAMRGTIPLPAQDVQTNVCNFNVPVGKLGYLDSIMLSIIDTGYVEGLGFAIWSISVNQPAGASFAIGRPIEGYGQITTQFGSIAAGPIKLPFGILLGSNDIVYINITIPSAPADGGFNPVNAGYPSTTTCWGFGWIWTEEMSEVGF